MTDPVAAAVAATPTVRMAQTQVTISGTGRPAMLAYPPAMLAYPEDMTDAELLELIGWMATALLAALAQRRGPTIALLSRIIVPS